ncbi:MAG: hypothetical protein ACLTSX_02705 [Collinsella sp.]
MAVRTASSAIRSASACTPRAALARYLQLTDTDLCAASARWGPCRQRRCSEVPRRPRRRRLRAQAHQRARWHRHRHRTTGRDAAAASSTWAGRSWSSPATYRPQAFYYGILLDMYRGRACRWPTSTAPVVRPRRQDALPRGRGFTKELLKKIMKLPSWRTTQPSRTTGSRCPVTLGAPRGQIIVIDSRHLPLRRRRVRHSRVSAPAAAELGTSPRAGLA